MILLLALAVAATAATAVESGVRLLRSLLHARRPRRSCTAAAFCELFLLTYPSLSAFAAACGLGAGMRAADERLAHGDFDLPRCGCWGLWVCRCGEAPLPLTPPSPVSLYYSTAAVGISRMLLFEQAVPMDTFDGMPSPGSYGGSPPPPVPSDTQSWPFAIQEEDASADELAALDGQPVALPPPAPSVAADASPTETAGSSEAGSAPAPGADVAAPADVPAPSPTAVPVQVQSATLLSHQSSRQDLSAGAALHSVDSRDDAAVRLAGASAGRTQWSGGQVAGIVLGMAAVGGVAAAAVVGYRRRARAASRYAFARGHEVEMRGLM